MSRKKNKQFERKTAGAPSGGGALVPASRGGAALLREGPEPTAGNAAVPVLLIAFLGLLVYFADINLSNRGGEFDPRVYHPFANLAEVIDAHPSDPLTKLRKVGKQYYGLYCEVCHQGNGRGLAGQFPPLAGSEWVQGEGPNRVVRIVLNAVAGPIDVSGTHFDSTAMPPWKPTLSDEQIASILTFVRNEWGNKAGPVTPEQVKKVRDQEKDRETPWSADELKKIPEKD
jgi:mono/diheme cytochrome c family protein